MDWIKKNMVFVVSCAVALIAIAASAYYLFVQVGKYDEAGVLLDGVVARVNGHVQKRPHPGFGAVDNLTKVKKDIEALDAFKAELTQTFKSTPLGDESELAFKSDLADVLAYIEKEGGRSGMTVPTNFNLSFTAQKLGFRFASNSLAPLSMQLADLREITRILVDARVNSIEKYRRAPVSEDDSGEWSVPEDYIRNLKIATNDFTGAVIHPYEVEFRCFSSELGKVLEGIAASPYSLILKTISMQPAEIRNLNNQVRTSASLYQGIPGMDNDPSSAAAREAAGKDGAAGRYGGAGGRDAGLSSRYGSPAGGTRARPGATMPVGASMSGLVPTREPLRPTGPVTLLKEEPLRVTLGFAAVRMPDPSADEVSNN